MTVSRVLLAAAFTAGVSALAQAAPVPINDYASGPSDDGSAYWGARTPTCCGAPFYDVVSNTPTDTSSIFEIKKAVVSVDYSTATTQLIVDIYTNYPGGLEGTHYGDLFLTGASSYLPIATLSAPAPHYAADNLNSTGTIWDYALALGTQTGATIFGDAYAVGGNANITRSYAPAGYEFRHDQPVEYNQGGLVKSPGRLEVSPTGNNAASDTGLYQLHFVIENLVALSALGSDAAGYSFGLLWAMTCANDVIAGFASFPGRPPNVPPPSVPIPGALPLLVVALGSLGVGFRGRRSRAS